MHIQICQISSFKINATALVKVSHEVHCQIILFSQDSGSISAKHWLNFLLCVSLSILRIRGRDTAVTVVAEMVINHCHKKVKSNIEKIVH